MLHAQSNNSNCFGICALKKGQKMIHNVPIEYCNHCMILASIMNLHSQICACNHPGDFPLVKDLGEDNTTFPVFGGGSSRRTYDLILPESSTTAFHK